MRLILRAPQDRDWPAVLALADRASPWKSSANPNWLENRKKAGADGAYRYHLLAQAPTGEVLGYAALEGGGRPGWLRVFLVVQPEHLAGAGELLYKNMMPEIGDVSPEGLWLREEPGDAELLDFFAEKGFSEAYRGRIESGLEIVVLELQERTDGT